MYFRDSDVVVELRLNVEVSDLESAVLTCGPLVQELDAAAMEFETADPDGGRRGFHVSLIMVSPAGSGVPGEVLARAAGPLLVSFGLPKQCFQIVGSVDDGTYAEYEGPERPSGELNVTGLTARFGRDARHAYRDGLAGVVSAGDRTRRFGSARSKPSSRRRALQRTSSLRVVNE